MPADDVLALARAIPKRALLVVDEAYAEFAEPEAVYSTMARFNETDNVVVLRTFSKLYGLAGLRLGFGVLPPEIADYLLRVRLPFSVNLLAEAAGLAALKTWTSWPRALRPWAGAGRFWPKSWPPWAARFSVPGQLPHVHAAAAGRRRLRGAVKARHHP